MPSHIVPFSSPRLALYSLVTMVACVLGALSTNGAETVRIMAANITSGSFQSYDPGHGVRIFQGLDPDIVLIQEFNYGDDSPGDIRDLVDAAFGTEFDYYREGGNEQIPNGVISRYPIIASGEWEDVQAPNRDFAWARIDIPGDEHLWVVSVHFLTTDGNTRPQEAAALVGFVQNQVPAGDYVVIGGDFNTDNFSESALNALSAVVTTNGRPNDQNGNTSTNAGRSKPYDQVLPDAALRALETPVIIAGHGTSYSDGLVFDSRVFTPLSAVSPVDSGDSATSGMQHMAVIRDFLIPDSGATEPSAYPAGFAGNAGESTITLGWSDVTSFPVPDGYLIRASINPAIGAPTDGVDETPDSDLSDGSAQIIVAANNGTASFSGLPFDTTYHFQIFPFTDAGVIDYKSDGSPPALTLTTLPDTSNLPDAPVVGPFYFVHGSGFTATWDKVALASGYRIDLSESPTFTGSVGAALIDEKFDASSDVPPGWTNAGTANDTLESHYGSASNCRALGSGDEIETSAVDFPTELSFYVDSSGGGNGNTGTVSYAVGAGGWQSLGSFTVSTAGGTEAIDLTSSPDLSAETGVRFRFESDFNTWYLDDVLVSGAAGLALVEGYEDLPVGDTDRFAFAGLDPSTSYYFRVRAGNESGISENSDSASVTTRASGTPFEVWSGDNGILPPDPSGDFDSDSLNDFGEYVFDTDPSTANSSDGVTGVEKLSGEIELTHRRSIAPGLVWNYFGSSELTDLTPPMVEGGELGQYQIIAVSRMGSHDNVTLRVNTGAAPRFFVRIQASASP